MSEPTTDRRTQILKSVDVGTLRQIVEGLPKTFHGTLGRAWRFATITVQYVDDSSAGAAGWFADGFAVWSDDFGPAMLNSDSLFQLNNRRGERKRYATLEAVAADMRFILGDHSSFRIAMTGEDVGRKKGEVD